MDGAWSLSGRLPRRRHARRRNLGRCWRTISATASRPSGRRSATADPRGSTLPRRRWARTPWAAIFWRFAPARTSARTARSGKTIASRSASGCRSRRPTGSNFCGSSSADRPPTCGAATTSTSSMPVESSRFRRMSGRPIPPPPHRSPWIRSGTGSASASSARNWKQNWTTAATQGWQPPTSTTPPPPVESTSGSRPASGNWPTSASWRFARSWRPRTCWLATACSPTTLRWTSWPSRRTWASAPTSRGPAALPRFASPFSRQRKTRCWPRGKSRWTPRNTAQRRCSCRSCPRAGTS